MMPSFEQLQDHAGRLTQQGVNPTLAGEDLIAAFTRALPDVQMVSFDVFDTLLVRRVHHPTDVFHFLESQAPFQQRTFPQPVARLRADAENLARHRAAQLRGSGEVVLPEIYAAFCEIAQVPAQLADAFVAAEEAIELLLCRPNPRLHYLFQVAGQKGKPIIAISDTYHRSAFLAKLLKEIGIPLGPSSLFASSEWRTNKQTGGLFQKVLHHLALDPARVLHLGDHPISDYRTPKALGMKVLLHGHQACAKHPGPYLPSAAAGPPSLLRSLASFESSCGDRLHRFWWLLGHNVFGPLLTGFCLWLKRRWQASGVERAYFLLRDGWIFQRVFTALFPETTNPSLYLLHASRRAFLLPLLGVAPDFVMPNLLVRSGPRPVSEYLTRLGIPAEPLIDEFRAAGFSTLSQAVDSRKEPQRLRGFFNLPAVKRALMQAAATEKDHLLAYLYQEKVLAGGRVALVDLGWHGTIHKSTHLLAEHLRNSTELLGYYLATSGPFRMFLPQGLRHETYLFGPNDAHAQAQTVRSCTRLLEIICSSREGSTVAFEPVEQAIKPVLLPNPIQTSQLETLDEIHDGIVAFARSFRELPEPWQMLELPPDVAAEEVCRLIDRPTKQEAALIGGLMHGDDFGTGIAHCLARFRPTSRLASELWEDYRNAYWKNGMLNQPNPQSAALRTLKWLAEP